MIHIVSNNEMTTPKMSKTRMKRLREAAGLTQRELAEKIGYSQVSVSRMETGEQTITDRAAKLVAIMTYQQPEAQTA